MLKLLCEWGLVGVYCFEFFEYEIFVVVGCCCEVCIVFFVVFFCVVYGWY